MLEPDSVAVGLQGSQQNIYDRLWHPPTTRVAQDRGRCTVIWLWAAGDVYNGGDFSLGVYILSVTFLFFLHHWPRRGWSARWAREIGCIQRPLRTVTCFPGMIMVILVQQEKVEQLGHNRLLFLFKCSHRWTSSLVLIPLLHVFFMLSLVTFIYLTFIGRFIEVSLYFAIVSGTNTSRKQFTWVRSWNSAGFNY